MKYAKKLLLCAAIIASAFAFSGCIQSEVVYDDYDDSFRYKPETEYDYMYNDL